MIKTEYQDLTTLETNIVTIALTNVMNMTSNTELSAILLIICTRDFFYSNGKKQEVEAMLYSMLHTHALPSLFHH